MVDNHSHSKMSHLESNKTICDDLSLEISEAAIRFSFIVILIVSVLGNSAVCVVVSRHYQLHTVTNAFLVNMAVTQLLFALLCISPHLRLSSNMSSQRSQSWLCVLIGFTFECFSALSNYALTLVIIERYYVIRNSGKKKISPKNTGKLIIFAWLWAVIFAIPSTILGRSSNDNENTCSGMLSKLACIPLMINAKGAALRICNIIYVVLCFLIPMSIIVSLLLKISKPLWKGSQAIRPIGAGNMRAIRLGAEIKTTRTMLFITVLHFCCWLPICVISLCLSLNQRQAESKNFRQAMVFSVCIAFASSAINALTYAFRIPRISIILRQSRPKGRKKRIQFYRKQENENGQPQTIRTVENWAQKTQSAMVWDNSKSEETLTSSF